MEQKEEEKAKELDLNALHPALKEVIENGGEMHDLSGKGKLSSTSDLGD